MKVVAIDQREFSKVHTCKIIYLVREFINKKMISKRHMNMISSQIKEAHP